MEPQFNGQKDDLKPHRSPTAEVVATKHGPALVEPPRVGVWDAEADDDLQQLAQVESPPADSRSRTPAVKTKPGKASTQTQRRLRLTQQALALRVSGLSINDIAAELAVSPSTVTSWFALHRRDVSGEAIDDMLDQIAVPLAAENLVHGLLAGDKDYTLETLKGRGRFRRHTEGEGKPPATLPELRISFELPTADQMAGRDGIPAGVVIGTSATPRQIVGTVVDTRTPAVLPSAHADTSADMAPAPDAVTVGRPHGAE